MKLAFSSNAFRNWSIEETVGILADLGYQGLELMADRPHAWPEDMTPARLESIRKATAKEGQPVRTSAVLRASRSCFTDAGKGSDASTELDPPSMIQYVGAMLLSAWVTEKGSQSSNKSADQPETLGTISTELASIRAQKFPAGEFEVPEGFKRAF